MLSHMFDKPTLHQIPLHISLSSQTRVSCVEKRARGGRRNAAGRQMPPRRVVFKSASERPRRWIYPTALILLRRRFLVYVSSHLLTVVLHSINIPLRRLNPSKALPFLHTAPKNFSEKIFGKVTISVIYSVL